MSLRGPQHLFPVKITVIPSKFQRHQVAAFDPFYVFSDGLQALVHCTAKLGEIENFNLLLAAQQINKAFSEEDVFFLLLVVYDALCNGISKHTNTLEQGAVSSV